MWLLLIEKLIFKERLEYILSFYGRSFFTYARKN